MYIDNVIAANPERRSCHGKSRMIKDVIRIDILEELTGILDRAETKIIDTKLIQSHTVDPHDEVITLPVDVEAIKKGLVFHDSRMIYNNMALNYKGGNWLWVSKIDEEEEGWVNYAVSWWHRERAICEWIFSMVPGEAEIPFETITPTGHRIEEDPSIWRDYPIYRNWAFTETNADGDVVNTRMEDGMDVDGAEHFDGAVAGTAFIMKTMAIINCKNVELEEEEPDAKLQKSRKRKGKLPLLSRHRVMIIPSAAQRKKGHAPQELWKNRAHTVRGHFKTFTEDAPLLGKITGTFWWSPFARGSVTEGVIEKEYELKALFE